MKLPIIAASLLAIGLAACVENEEEITIRPDGSSTVRLSAKGKVDDLADGYNLPLTAPWTASDADTLEWIRVFGPDSGSPAVRETVARGAIDADREMKLEVRAEFASVQDWPRWFAPESEVYKSAYLERGASLAIETKSGRKVYTFERAFHARDFERFDAMAQLKKRLPEELFHRIEKDPKLSAEERAKLAHEAVDAMRKTSIAFVNDALGSVFTSGDASLPASKVRRIEESVAEEMARVVNEKRLAAVLDFEIPSGPGAKPPATTGDDDARSAKTLERDIRTALRSALGAALAGEGVPTAMQNAIRGQLEWSLTAYDHTCDLADESFEVTVHMPGTVVAGNFDQRTEDAVTWKFDGKELQDRERVLRVVSVVE